MDEKMDLEEALAGLDMSDPAAMMAGAVQGALMQLPPVRYAETTVTDGFIPLPDGVRLHYKLYMPKAEGPWPVILVRNPYTAVGLIVDGVYGPVFSQYGYAFLHVNVRGSLESEGEFDPLVRETEDGKAVLDWIAQQPWCNGSLGTMGESYLGHVQWSVAGLHHPLLKTMYIGVYGVRGYHFFYRRGMFRTELGTTWSAQMMGHHRRELIMPPQLFELQQKAYAVKPQVNLGEELIGEPVPWYKTWATATFENDPYWQTGFWRELYEVVDKITVPIHFQGGWFDIFLRSELESYRRLPRAIREKSRFVIEPYSHGGATGGSLDYPDADRLGMFQIRGALEWFDYQLKGMSYPHPLGVVEGYVIRDGSWKIWQDDLPDCARKTLYLSAAGLTEKKDGAVSERHYVYDPADPVETLGGNLISNNRDPFGAPENSVEQLPIGARQDVLSFVSEPLVEDRCITGRMKAHLFVSSDAPATAFTVKVMELLADGRSVNIQDDITDIRCVDETRIEDYTPGTARELTLELIDTCWKLHKGSRVRVDISSSNYPAFHAHPNVADCWAETTETCLAYQTLYCGGEAPSRVEIPME